MRRLRGDVALVTNSATMQQQTLIGSKVAEFANTLPTRGFPSSTAANKFLELPDVQQQKILDQTKITITRAEFDHARNFLALIALTQGQQIPEHPSQKAIYVEQGILPEGLPLAGAGDLKAQILELGQHISPEHIQAFYKRLIEKRPLVSYMSDDETLLRDGTRMRGAGCSGNHNPKEYTLYSEAEFAAMLQVSGPTQFINDGNRGNGGQLGNGLNHETSGIISSLVGMRLETELYPFFKQPLPLKLTTEISHNF